MNSFCEKHGWHDFPISGCRECRNTRPSPWKPIEEAPKGGGAERVTDKNWVEPPELLLLFSEGVMAVGKWDWYYAEGGRGCTDGVAWIEPCVGTLLSEYYGEPTNFMELPQLPDK